MNSEGDSPEKGATRKPSFSIEDFLGAVHVAGVLAACGFIVKFAREEFLGTRSDQWNVTQLSALAGSFVLDSAISLCHYLLDWRVLLSCTLIACFLFGGRYLLQNHRPHARGLIPFCAYIGVFTALLTTFLWEQVPTSYLRDFLSTAPESQPNISLTAHGYKRANELSRLIFGARIGGDPQYATQYPILNGFNLDPQHARDLLEQRYARSVLICALAWALLRSWEQLGLTSRFRLAAQFPLILLLLAATIMLPYSYGKLIHSTEFPIVDLHFKEGHTEGISKMPTTYHGPLLSQDDKSVDVLAAVGGIPSVMRIPLDQIESFHMYASEDAFTFVLRNRPPAPGPLPPNQ